MSGPNQSVLTLQVPHRLSVLDCSGCKNRCVPGEVLTPLRMFDLHAVNSLFTTFGQISRYLRMPHRYHCMYGVLLLDVVETMPLVSKISRIVANMYSTDKWINKARVHRMCAGGNTVTQASTCNRRTRSSSTAHHLRLRDSDLASTDRMLEDKEASMADMTPQESRLGLQIVD